MMLNYFFCEKDKNKKKSSVFFILLNDLYINKGFQKNLVNTIDSIVILNKSS